MEKTEERLSFSAEVAKILKLMVHSIYKNKDIFLRELISNASDACDKLKFEALANPSLLGSDVLKIGIILNAAEGTLSITDNGIGMSREDLINNLGTIARSGTAEFAAQVGKSSDVSLIGQFGVGFYSSFMAADEVIVTSRKAGEDKGHIWKSNGDGSFTISEADNAQRGTVITMRIKSEEQAYLDKHHLQFIIRTYSDHIAYPIEFSDGAGEGRIVNTAAAIWTRPKQELTAQQYNEFYRHAAHAGDEPWLVIHNRNEGVVEYTNLLFIPSTKPFDLFHPDRIRRVKLYVKRVFITDEEVDIIPHYLRFLRGIVDSEDLPLNISRETLQHNAVLDKIRHSLVKRVLQELKKKASENQDDYEGFIRNFGAILKEGLCEGITPKHEIMEVCRFATTAHTNLTSLDDYITRMQNGQEDIYYLNCESRDEALQSPILEGFTSKGYEVLLFTDHVDDFWVNTVHEYKDKKLKSITRSGIDLKNSTEKSGDEPSAQADKGDMEKLLAALRELYGTAVKDVVITGKLNEIPAVISTEEGQMDIRFEKFLLDNKQLAGKSSKILEINPEHAVIRGLSRILSLSGSSDQFKELACMVLDQARIISGEEVEDRAAFARRLCRLMNDFLSVA